MLRVKMIHIRIEHIHNSNPLHVLRDPVWFITIENAARWTDKIYCSQKENTVVKKKFHTLFLPCISRLFQSCFEGTTLDFAQLKTCLCSCKPTFCISRCPKATVFANKTPVANEQGRLYNIDTGIAGDKVFPQSTQKCQKIEDAFLDAISA